MAVQQPTFTDPDRLRNYDEAAAFFGVKRRTVEDLVARRELACTHVGRQVRFTQAAIDDYVARQTRPAA